VFVLCFAVAVNIFLSEDFLVVFKVGFREAVAGRIAFTVHRDIPQKVVVGRWKDIPIEATPSERPFA
jgi:hypothetical protein